MLGLEAPEIETETANMRSSSTKPKKSKKHNEKVCQCCGESRHVMTVSVFGTQFTVCPYCRNDACETLEMTILWERYEDDEEEVESFGSNGGAVVFDGCKEIFRRGFGLRDL